VLNTGGIVLSKKKDQSSRNRRRSYDDPFQACRSAHATLPQLLQQAFIEVAHEKGMVATTVQDITERADVNRGTFYLHFEDKYALLQTIIHEHFQHLLTRTLSPASQWDRSSLHRFIQAVLEDFERKYCHLFRSQEVSSLIERATCEELARLLLLWLKQNQSRGARELVPLETIAQIMSWTIFEAAIQWSQETTTVSSEQLARDILLVMTEGVTRLVPFAFSE
jgi:AcrR family transcriptional regulator